MSRHRKKKKTRVDLATIAVVIQIARALFSFFN